MATGRLLPKKTKAGTLIPASFSGEPKVAAVVFASAFPGGYSLTVDIVTSDNVAFSHTIQNKSSSGFAVNVVSNTLTGLVEVNWSAVQDGES